LAVMLIQWRFYWESDGGTPCFTGLVVRKTEASFDCDLIRCFLLNMWSMESPRGGRGGVVWTRMNGRPWDAFGTEGVTEGGPKNGSAVIVEINA
jgi:hypothetical protein